MEHILNTFVTILQSGKKGKKYLGKSKQVNPIAVNCQLQGIKDIEEVIVLRKWYLSKDIVIIYSQLSKKKNQRQNKLVKMHICHVIQNP